MTTRREYGAGNIEERSAGRWRITVQLPARPNTRKRPRRRFTIQGTKRDAQKALREALNERDHGGVDPNRLMTGEWLSHWLERHIADGALGLRAAERNRGIVRRNLDPALGSVQLQDLRAEHVIELKEDLSKTLAPATVKKILGLLRQGLEAAVVGQLLVRNPASTVPSPSLTGSTEERRALSEGEIEKLLSAASCTRHDIAIRIALATGARQAELLGASWESMDLKHGTFHVQRTLQHVAGEFRVIRPKTRNSRRTIELSAATVALLRRHRAEQNAERLRSGSLWQDRDLLLPDPLGGYQHRRSFYRGFRRLVDGCGIEDPDTVNFHALRHSAASLWIRAGVDVFTVSRRLGHASASFTMDVYGHLFSGQQRTAAEALDHLIG
jgi:integrase